MIERKREFIGFVDVVTRFIEDSMYWKLMTYLCLTRMDHVTTV